MVRPKEVKALEGYCLWLRYSDGVEGKVDLSHLAGRGVFKAWQDRAFFEAVRIDEAGAIVWGEEIDLCPDALYLRLTGKPPEEVFRNLKLVRADA
ncbi:MAG: DUF2442 domain-containing protein [Candidatus Bipolaricaulia bacterium]